MEVVPDMVQSVDRNTCAVQSFTNAIVSYEIKVREQKMISCNCRDFVFNKNNSKHMFLLNRLYPSITLCTVNFQETVHDNSMNNSNEVENNVVNEETLSLDNATENLASMLATYRTYVENPGRIDEEELTILKDAALIIQNILDCNTIVDSASNKRLARQRR